MSLKKAPNIESTPTEARALAERLEEASDFRPKDLRVKAAEGLRAMADRLEVAEAAITRRHDAETSARLQEIRARIAAASEGPWHWSDPFRDGCARLVEGDLNPERFFAADLPDDDDLFCLHNARERLAEHSWCNDGTSRFAIRPADREFIEHARDDIPWLLEELQRRTAQARTTVFAEVLAHWNDPGYDEGEIQLWLEQQARGEG